LKNYLLLLGDQLITRLFFIVVSINVYICRQYLDYYTLEIVDILFVFRECQVNYHEVSRVYRNRYPEREQYLNYFVIRDLKQRARQDHLRR